MERMLVILSMLKHTSMYPGSVSLCVTWTNPALQWIFVIFSDLWMFFWRLVSHNTSMKDNVLSRIQLGLIHPFWKNVRLWMNSSAWSLSFSRLFTMESPLLVSTEDHHFQTYMPQWMRLGSLAPGFKSGDLGPLLESH